MRSIKAFAVIRNNKLDALEIYADDNVVLDKGEKLVRVIISEEKR
jgi:hypothetical protein